MSPAPPVTILLALYDPDPGWLRQLLRSLDAQTCPNLALLACDDASPTVPHSAIRAIFAETLSRLPWRLERNPANLGSTATFERLTREATGEFLAYCDQDDIWLPHKTLALRDALLRDPSALLACSDMSVIDASGRETAPSITRIRRRIRFRSGPGLARHLLYQNFVTGAAMLVRAAPARECLPFLPGLWYHDQQIAFHCALRGSIVSLPEPLLQYRIHDRNQTPLLPGVRTPADYYARILHPYTLHIRALAARYPGFAPIAEAAAWADAREARYRRAPGSFRALHALRRLKPSVTWFELLAFPLPRPLFRLLASAIRRGHL